MLDFSTIYTSDLNNYSVISATPEDKTATFEFTGIQYMDAKADAPATTFINSKCVKHIDKTMIGLSPRGIALEDTSAISSGRAYYVNRDMKAFLQTIVTAKEMAKAVKGLPTDESAKSKALRSTAVYEYLNNNCKGRKFEAIVTLYTKNDEVRNNLQPICTTQRF